MDILHKPKKIIHLITGLETGGAEMMLLKILPRLKEDFEHTVCCMKGHGPVGDLLKENGIRVIYLDMKSIFDFKAASRFRKFIKEIEPDLLVTYLVHADLFGRIFGRLFGVKIIYCSIRVKLIQLKYIPFLIFDGISSFMVDHYHFNSKSARMMYNKLFFMPDRKCTVIPNGLDVMKYEISAEDKSAKLKELGLQSSGFLFGCVANLRAQKGHSYLLTAFQDILQKFPRSKLLLIGDGDERKNLESLSSQLNIQDNVIFLGNRNDVPELLSIIDAFVFPTLFEGMSNALMEAMASQVPIIATDIDENKEVIDHGINGILVPVKNVDAMSEAMADFVVNKEKAALLAKNARKYALDNFSIEKIASQYRELFSR